MALVLRCCTKVLYSRMGSAVRFRYMALVVLFALPGFCPSTTPLKPDFLIHNPYFSDSYSTRVQVPE